MISVINYGVSNIGSMLNMLKKIAVPATAVSRPEEIARAEKIILPGVGAFDNGMKALNEMGLSEPLIQRVTADRVPLLGVCLGMQMLADCSQEGQVRGLGLIGGTCVRFQSGGPVPLKVPHMGWDELVGCKESRLLFGLERPRFYFVHSYHFVCARPEDELARAHHGIDFTAAIERGNIWGVQFHPEKSHRFGMALLRNFAAL
jgi:imidazole glycerol-phosphate synthase subunit HisH